MQMNQSEPQVTQVVYDATERSVITMNENDLYRYISDYTKKIEKSRGWFSYLMTFISLLGVLVTSNFKNLVFSSEIWLFAFVVITAIFGFLTVRAMWYAWTIKDSPESFIKSIKTEALQKNQVRTVKLKSFE